MNKLLKGNYELEKEEILDTTINIKAEEDFEEQIIKRLGGSIAFVMKKNRFVWDDEDIEDQ